MNQLSQDNLVPPEPVWPKYPMKYANHPSLPPNMSCNVETLKIFASELGGVIYNVKRLQRVQRNIK